jgi:hypothetical protein
MTFSRPSLKFAFASLAKIAQRSPPGDKRGGGKKITLAAEGNKKKEAKTRRKSPPRTRSATRIETRECDGKNSSRRVFLARNKKIRNRTF